MDSFEMNIRVESLLRCVSASISNFNNFLPSISFCFSSTLFFLHNVGIGFEMELLFQNLWLITEVSNPAKWFWGVLTKLRAPFSAYVRDVALARCCASVLHQQEVRYGKNRIKETTKKTAGGGTSSSATQIEMWNIKWDKFSSFS